MKKQILILFILLSATGFAQQFEYEVTFEGIGDNREFFSGLANSQTILGSRGAIEVGVTIDNHRIRGGLSQLLEFGSALNFHNPKLTLYYEYSDEQKEFLFGAFPRHGRISFPLAMLTDTLH